MPTNSGNVEKIEGITESLFHGPALPNAQTSLTFDVPVLVDQSKCITGCTLCVEACPVDCLAIDPVTRKSHMKFDECWYCLACEVDCPANAITVKMPFLIR